MAPTPVGFSWVNYTCASIVEKNEEDTSIVKSHAMRVVHHRESQEESHILPIRSDSRSARRKRRGFKRTVNNLQPLLPARKIAKEPKRKPVDIDPHKPNTDLVECSCHYGEAEKRSINSPTDYPLMSASFISGNHCDPFACMAIRMTSEVHTVLQYHLTFDIMCHYRAEALAKHEPAYRHRQYPVIQKMVGYALTKQPVLFALLAYTSARMAHNRREKSYREKQTNTFMVEAVRGLRMELQGERDVLCDEDVLIVLLFMSIAEWYRQDYQAYHTHMNVLKVLLRRSRPLTLKTKEEFETQFRFWDVFTAAEALCRPTLPLTWQSPQLTSAKIEEIYQRLNNILGTSIRNSRSTVFRTEAPLTDEDMFHGRQGLFGLALQPANVGGENSTSCAQDCILSDVAEGFYRLVNSALLSPAFSALMTDHLLPWSWMNSLCRIDADVAAEELDWLSKAAVANLHRLLSFPETPCSSSRRALREEAVRLMLIMLLTDVTSPVAWRSASRYVMQLQKVMHAMEGHGNASFDEVYCPSKLEGELTLWILNLGLCAASTLAEAGEVDVDPEWFASRAERLALCLHVHTFEQMYKLMWRFVASGVMWVPCMARLMDRISAARA